ncbi:MAG: hypothetical protein IPL39_15220 [Opitutaceae bacterium]|nr:hypothetical protein [Opitutaceae bacterium]
MPQKEKTSASQPKKGRDYRLETYFVGGKMKHRRIPLIEGQPVDEFLRAHADDGFLAAEGYFEILGERAAETQAAEYQPEGDGMIPICPMPMVASRPTAFSASPSWCRLAFLRDRSRRYGGRRHEV